tara:strand:- start:3748 stop:4437 length:690 start_codon:yes stop_codon:yes gene_type:complete
MTSQPGTNFFDLYPEFYESGANGHLSDRLNNRYKAIIDWNRDYIKDAKILDIAAHDGRWAFASLMSGAKFCDCIEPREHIIKRGKDIFSKYDMLGSKCIFHPMQIHEWFYSNNTKEPVYDVAFCLGYLYHTLYHYDLLYKLLSYAKTVIIDTRIIKYQDTVIRVRQENIESDLSSFSETLVATPSKSAIEVYLSQLNCEWEYYDWDKSESFSQCGDYKDGNRITMRITK